MKKKTPHQELADWKEGIMDSLRRWNDLNTHGGSDPCWNDGYNMNLVRNHILYYRWQIQQLCETYGWCLPSEYYLPIPPQVPDTYMANKNQRMRIQKLRTQHRTLTFDKIVFDDTQLSFL